MIALESEEIWEVAGRECFICGFAGLSGCYECLGGGLFSETWAMAAIMTDHRVTVNSIKPSEPSNRRIHNLVVITELAYRCLEMAVAIPALLRSVSPSSSQEKVYDCRRCHGNRCQGNHIMLGCVPLCPIEQ